MVELTFDTEFALVKFWAQGEGVIGTGSGPKASPQPEPGVRIDWCQLESILLNSIAGSVFEIGLDYKVKEGWQAWEEGGEAFMCTLFEHVEGHQAAIGFRDYEWIEEKMDLSIQSAAKLPAKPLAKYKAKTSAQFEFEISLAMTTSPSDETEALSPWLFVDKALKF